MIEDANDRPRRHKADGKKGLLAAIDNGIGLRLSRLMIIVGLPVISSLGIYAFNVTMSNIKMMIDDTRKDVTGVAKGLDEVHSDIKEINSKLTDAQMSIVRLQSGQDTDRRTAAERRP